MTEIKELEKVGATAVRRLRMKKLKQGNPFMINLKELPSGQCYLEYPNGKISLVTFASGSSDFVTLHELTDQERTILRSQLDLDYVAI
jgi:hypothetical protein